MLSEQNLFKQKFSKLMKTCLVTGLIVVVPILVTFWIGWWSFSLLTDWSVQLLSEYFPEWSEFVGVTLLVRLVTIIVLAIIVLLIGLLARVALGRKLIQIAQRIMLNLPILRIVYSTCAQIGETVKNQQGGLFKQAVLFEYPRKGCWSVGFITSYNEESFEVTEHFRGGVYSVFLPTTPNPTSGFLLYVPKDECIPLNMPVGEAMRLIVSGGVVLPGSKVRSENE